MRRLNEIVTSDVMADEVATIEVVISKEVDDHELIANKLMTDEMREVMREVTKELASSNPVLVLSYTASKERQSRREVSVNLDVK